MRDYKLLTTSDDIARFQELDIWKDFCIIAHARIEAIKDDLVNAQTIERLRYLQGELNGVSFWLQFPEAMKEQLKQQEEIENAKQKPA